MHRGQTHQIQCVFTTNSFFIKNSLCYLPLVHIWQSWTFKASLLRYMPIIHHVCLKVFTFITCISLHDKSNSYIHVIFRHYIMQFEIQEHLSMFKKNVKKHQTDSKSGFWQIALSCWTPRVCKKNKDFFVQNKCDQISETTIFNFLINAFKLCYFPMRLKRRCIFE